MPGITMPITSHVIARAKRSSGDSIARYQVELGADRQPSSSQREAHAMSHKHFPCKRRFQKCEFLETAGLVALVLTVAGAMSIACGRLSYDPVASTEADASVPACDLPSGLVAHLAFDESNGDKAADASGNGNDGQLVELGDTDWVAGRIGNALDFDGKGGHVNSGSRPSVDDLPTMTLCAWIFPRSYPSQYPAIADKSEDTFTGGWNFYIETGNVLGFLTNHRKWATGGTIALNQWQHACASWDGSGGSEGIALYLDGNAIAIGNTGSNGNATDSDEARNLLIGRVNNATFEFDGLIDEFQLYGRVLAPAEIALIHGCAAP